MVQTIRVCMGTSCQSIGSSHAIRDIEELVNGQCSVEEYGCLNRCGFGPNVEIVQDSGKTSIVQGLEFWKPLLEMVQEDCGIQVPSLSKKVGKLRFQIRREEEAGKRSEQLKKAFELLGDPDDPKHAADPLLLGSVLLLRAKENMKSAPQEAVKDAEKAAALAPKWAQSHYILAQVLEAAGRSGDGVLAMKTAMEIGAGLNRGQAKRMLTRMERKSKDEPATAASATPASESEKKEAKKAKTGDSGKAKAPAPESTSEPSPPPLPPPASPAPETEEEVPEFLEWSLDSVKMLNHDCIRMIMTCAQIDFLDRQQEDAGEIWHIDILKENADGTELKREYTPVSNKADYKAGNLDLMVKIYPGGKMTSFLAKLRPGIAKMLVGAPHATLNPADYRGLVMVAGGSAVTVGIQVSRAVLEHHKGAVPVHLILCNKTISDVLFKEVFDDMIAEFPTFHMIHCISSGEVPKSAGRHTWQKGRISSATLAVTEPDLKCVISGPKGLCQAAMVLWSDMGRDAESVKVLDELPVPGSQAAKDAEAKVKPPPPPVLQEPEQESMKSGKTAQQDLVTQPAGFSLLQQLFLPFTICRGRGLEEEGDADGTSAVAAVS